MKTILYMAISANGMIAQKNDDTSWISPEEWDSYSLMARTAGNIVIGHRTYDIITKQPEFAEFKDIKVVIVSSQNFQTLSNNHTVVHSPQEALKRLEKFNEVIVAGGSILNLAFMKADLIDEIYLDIEPIVIGSGIPIFANEKFDRKLQLLDMKKITDNVIQLHYKVLG
ncbi:MAG: dihydrofolate reductase family protein [Patescibacteria group bacterium]